MFRSALLLGAAGIALLSAASPGWAQPHAPAVESVVVTATPLAGSNLATIPSKVDADQILQQGGSSLADSLANVPGVSTFGSPRRRHRSALRARPLSDQGQSALGREADATQTPRGQNLHGHVWSFLHRPG